jgi:YfiH family protein
LTSTAGAEPDRVAWLVPRWAAPARVRALSTFRTGGASRGAYGTLNLADHVGDAPEDVAENRRRLRLAADLPAEPVWLRQVHGNAVRDLDRDGPNLEGAGYDAAVTREASRVCAILTADCLPVLFASVDGSAVAAAHAGWRGLAAGVLGATLRALALPPTQVLAWIGPAIGAPHYEVGEEVRAALVATDPGAAAAFTRNDRGRFQADLVGLARRQLAELGLREIQAAEPALACTYAQAGRFFSHRRDAGADSGTGRQGTLIWLQPGLTT